MTSRFDPEARKIDDRSVIVADFSASGTSFAVLPLGKGRGDTALSHEVERDSEKIGSGR
jgi:hypothetical protein